MTQHVKLFMLLTITNHLGEYDFHF